MKLKDSKASVIRFASIDSAYAEYDQHDQYNGGGSSFPGFSAPPARPRVHVLRLVISGTPCKYFYDNIEAIMSDFETIQANIEDNEPVLLKYEKRKECSE